MVNLLFQIDTPRFLSENLIKKINECNYAKIIDQL